MAGMIAPCPICKGLPWIAGWGRKRMHSLCLSCPDCRFRGGAVYAFGGYERNQVAIIRAWNTAVAQFRDKRHGSA